MKKTFFLLIGIMLITTSSCQKKLNREDAKRMISSNKNYPVKKNYEIIKAFKKDVNTDGGGVTVVLGEDEFKQKQSIIEQFASLGLLKLTETPHREETSNFLLGTTVRTWTVVEVSLTDNGTKYLVQNNSGTYIVNLWETDVNDVTGIQELEGNKSAKVDYTISNKNITPFGQIFNDRNEVISRIAYFSLYDDGWRMQ